MTGPLLTCEAVLAEAAFHLESVGLVLAMVQQGLVELAFDCREHLLQLASLAARYAGRHPDLADLCLIRMSELHPRHPVLTVDRTDFRVYRRDKREAIPLICPPESRSYCQAGPRARTARLERNPDSAHHSSIRRPCYLEGK